MSLLSVAPNIFTGMVTIPKLMEPLQIALGIFEPPNSGFGVEEAGAFPQSIGVIHKLST